MKRYPKLVRDDIPEQIRARGATPLIRVATNEEIVKLLLEKLREEVSEFEISPSMEELADILEVIDALKLASGMKTADLDAVKEQKRIRNGGFSKGFVLEGIKEI